MTLLLLTLVLVVPSMLFGMADRLLPDRDISAWTGAKVGVTLLFLLSGSAHFTDAEAMASMLPPSVPLRIELVHLTGGLELLAAIGLWVPSASRTVGLLLVVMLALFLPVNVWAAFNHVPFGGHGNGPVYLLARVPFQLLLMGWIWATTRPSHGSARLQRERPHEVADPTGDSPAAGRVRGHARAPARRGAHHRGRHRPD